MAFPCRLNAAPTITLAPPARKTVQYKKVIPSRVRDGCGKLPDGYWKLIKNNPPVVPSNITGIANWYTTGEFKTHENRICLYTGAFTLSLVNSSSLTDLEIVPTLFVPDADCNTEEYLIFDGTEFLLVTPEGTTQISIQNFTTANVKDVVPLPRKDLDEFLVVKTTGEFVWATLEGTVLTGNQTLSTGINAIESAAVSYRCLNDECTQRYTVLVVDENHGTTTFALWRVNGKLAIAEETVETGTMEGNGELALATDQVRLETVGALTHNGTTRILRYEPTQTNKYAKVYYSLDLPDTIAHLGTCDGVIDIILENAEWIRIQDGKAYHLTPVSF